MWCREKGISPVLPSISDILDYLLSLKDRNLKVSSIATIKTALSTILPPIDNVKIGKHPEVISFFKGLYNQYPQLPKNPPKWQVDEVLEKIITWGNNLTLEIKFLTWKLAMLFALTSAGRCSELSRLCMMHSTSLPDGFRFRLTSHKKNDKTSAYPGTLFIPTFPDNPIICPVKCMEWYLIKTAAFRSGINEDIPEGEEELLFRSISQPQLGITPKTFSTWVTTCIVGETPSESMGHEARGAGTTKAFYEGKLSLQEIMDGANWRSDSVFRQFYRNPEFNPKMGRAVLNIKP